MKNLLLYLVDKYKGDRYLMNKGLGSLDQVTRRELLEIMNKYKNLNFKSLTVLDENYYTEFFALKSPPLIVFYYGNWNLMEAKNKIYLLNEIDCEQTQKLFNENLSHLVENCTIVTNNFASQSEFIKVLKQHNARIIYIASEGLDTVDLSEYNSENNLIISQYPLKTHPKRHHFKEANILASLIAKQLIIFSSNKITPMNGIINQFIENGKPVNCFPGLSLDDGNNFLVKNGANLITSLEDCI
ncbi:DNA-processing protein DprA [Mycoplasma nasistruthionis]|uniref:DNA processing protein n=1 Tax=Mycoplasma nasistruthionis TaxID=353852 RepID=A0A4Y6I6I8_9MOLU|nr:DNA-processing protein DprA [Mycoplasma nasistruthionis]QDF65255.1 DNA processing protein [Mycoplasma nasistruthionis]